jgi:hypothetical protein
MSRDSPLASRRAVLGGVGCLAVALSARSAAAERREPDMLAYMLKNHGRAATCDQGQPCGAAQFADRVPDRLIRFWIEHGRGSYADGMYWICDPLPFDPVLETIFKGDPEFDPADMTVVAYEAFGTMKAWHRRRRSVLVHLTLSQIYNAPEKSWHDADGQPFSEDFSIGASVGIVSSQWEQDTLRFLAAAIARHGALAPGEAYGYFPALQLGGVPSVENLRRVKASEHFMLLAQLERFKLTRLTLPKPSAHPYGRSEVVRLIGSTDR